MEMVVFSGIQASGKSTLFRQRFVETHLRINLDMLRTRYREGLLMDACLRAKQPFVVENTNLTALERARYLVVRDQTDGRGGGIRCAAANPQCLHRAGAEAVGSGGTPASADGRRCETGSTVVGDSAQDNGVRRPPARGFAAVFNPRRCLRRLGY